VATYRENPRARAKTLESLGLPTAWWHGTTQDFERLSFSKNVLGVVWLADFESAKAYADKHYAKAERKWLVEVELNPDMRVIDLTDPEEPFIDELVALLNQAAEGRGFAPTRTREEWLANRYQYGDLETYPFVVALLKKRGVGALIMNDVQGWGGHAPTKSLALLGKKNIVDQTRRRLSDFEARANPLLTPEAVITGDEAAEIEAFADAHGKQAGFSMETAHALVREKGDYVLVRVPVGPEYLRLDSDEPGHEGIGARRTREYAQLDTEPPPIRIGFGPQAARRGLTSAVVWNGNHRVRAARLQGRPSLLAMMPVEDFRRWRVALDGARG
jgi:hypothetical protein